MKKKTQLKISNLYIYFFINTKLMLVNLSNHPSSKWNERQLITAIQKYQKVIDVPFPNIPPTYTKQEVQQLSKKYVRQILEKSPSVVHIMGEMTFTYTMVNLLKAANIQCIASTTERIVKEESNGQRITTFKFTQFREY